jgi:hypothetical protein
MVEKNPLIAFDFLFLTQDTSLPDELKAFEAGVVAGLGEKGAGVSLR